MSRKATSESRNHSPGLLEEAPAGPQASGDSCCAQRVYRTPHDLSGLYDQQEEGGGFRQGGPRPVPMGGSQRNGAPALWTEVRGEGTGEEPYRGHSGRLGRVREFILLIRLGADPSGPSR